MTAALFLVQLSTTLAMTGIICFVQLVHYPLFLFVPDPHHSAFAREHQRRTGWVVAPLMLLELASAVAFLFSSVRPAPISAAQAWFAFLLLAFIWISTFAVQVPCHSQLLNGAGEHLCRRLIRGNWIRTLGWTARAAILLYWTANLAAISR